MLDPNFAVSQQINLETECSRLRTINAELVNALKIVLDACQHDKPWSCQTCGMDSMAQTIVENAIRKAEQS